MKILLLPSKCEIIFVTLRKSPFSYCSSIYRDSWKSDNFRERAIKKKQNTDTKKVAKRINIDNFTRSNREKSNIAIAILEKIIIRWQHNYLAFWW